MEFLIASTPIIAPAIINKYVFDMTFANAFFSVIIVYLFLFVWALTLFSMEHMENNYSTSDVAHYAKLTNDNKYADHIRDIYKVFRGKQTL